MNRQADERRVLQALCQITDACLREQARDGLRNYSWAVGEHQVIFEAWLALERTNSPIEPAQLAAQLTRAGFPDIDLEDLFEPLPSPGATLARWLGE